MHARCSSFASKSNKRPENLTKSRPQLKSPLFMIGACCENELRATERHRILRRRRHRGGGIDCDPVAAARRGLGAVAGRPYLHVAPRPLCTPRTRNPI
ncbi:hypothetical protein EVAR_11009_1 [Eumeta japonica]|uniref:Uncharacterized protein n=1 Tax=Eumeta variegata TaxID=151549 RepID=A0A4C1YNC9_EUMVA|nr:hypothetical protein EVAR_11009_1 [Eumeta japonica]